MQNKNLNYRPDIDGLRAIAVSSVIMFHAFPGLLPGGFIGVDVFFVISGYLITSILLKTLDRGEFSILEFYGRRIRRIFPALALVLSACMIAGWFLLFPDEYAELGKHTAGGAGFVANLVLWSESGYFDVTAAKKPLLHLWSLGIEEQFYFFWPALLWAAWKLRLNILTICLVALIGSFLLNTHNIASDPVSVFYLPDTRMWELLTGAMLAYVELNFGQCRTMISKIADRTVGRVIFHRPSDTDGRLLANFLSLAGTGLICFGLESITKATHFPGRAALVPSIGAALVIAAGEKALINRWLLASKPFVWIGLISYPLYLWHWPILSFARIINGTELQETTRLYAVLSAVLLSALTYLLVELPLRSSEFRFKVPSLVAVMIAIGGVGYGVFDFQGLPTRPLIAKTTERNSQFVGPIWKYATNTECLTHYPFAEANSYGWWFCAANSDKPPTILLLGNSFANHLYPGLVDQKNIGNKSILSIGACEIDAAIDTNENDPTTPNPCSGARIYHQKLLIDKIIEAGSIKYAIIDGLDVHQSPETIQRVSERVNFLKKNGVEPIIFVPHLTTEGDLKGCFARPLKPPVKKCEVGISEKQKLDSEFQPLVTALAKTNPDVKFFDQNELICGSKTCSFVLDGMPVFRDEYSHYSVFASDKLASLFAEWAKDNAPGILAAH